MRTCHCIQCGKEYKYWGCINNHFKKEHPESKYIFRTIEMLKSINDEAKSYMKYTRIPWIKENGNK